MHNPAVNPSRITFNTPGLYLIHLQFAFQSLLGAVRAYAEIRLGGTTSINLDLRAPVQSASGTIMSLSTLWPMAANQYIEAVAFHDFGAPRDVQFLSAHSADFMAQLLSQ